MNGKVETLVRGKKKGGLERIVGSIKKEGRSGTVLKKEGKSFLISALTRGNVRRTAVGGKEGKRGSHGNQ